MDLIRNEPDTLRAITSNRKKNSTYLRCLQYEINKWGQIFAQDIHQHGIESRSMDLEMAQRPLWFKIADRDILDVAQNKKTELILEAGCGSGIRGKWLAQHLGARKLVLLDATSQAIAYSKRVSCDFSGETQYVISDIANMPLESNKFDLTFNVGVLEHYDRSSIGCMVKEMFRVTRPNGKVLIGIPNRCSLAVLKAFFLGTEMGLKIFPFVGGYKFDSEKLYGKREFVDILEEFTGTKVDISYAGSITNVGANERVIRFLDLYFRNSWFSFLTIFTIKKV